jgi:hypothetical protein
MEFDPKTKNKHLLDNVIKNNRSIIDDKIAVMNDITTDHQKSQ